MHQRSTYLSELHPSLKKQIGHISSDKTTPYHALKQSLVLALPSLVLGRLGEALNGPHGSQEPYPNLLALLLDCFLPYVRSGRLTSSVSLSLVKDVTFSQRWMMLTSWQRIDDAVSSFLTGIHVPGE